jgi:antirestriction protein
MERQPGTGGGEEEELRQVVRLTESGSLPEATARRVEGVELAGDGGSVGDTGTDEWGAVADDEEQARAELLARIEGASVSRLGELVVIEMQPGSDPTVGPAEAADEPKEFDPFSWDDAMHWSDDRPELHNAPVDEELGGAGEIGWFGLLRHQNQPGGWVLSETPHGRRDAWETDSDGELAAYWAQVERQHDAFVVGMGLAGRNAGANVEDQVPGETASGYHPEIWVGSLRDYNAGYHHGVWLDATLDPEDLHDAVQFMLRNGYVAGGKEWAIFDHDDFCGVSLGEYESLETVSRIAQGIAEHGEVFAAWAEYVGTADEDALERFDEHFLGRFDSMEAYVEQYRADSDAYDFERFLPDWLQPYVQVDVEMLARDMEIELHVVEARGGGVLVFDTRV